MQGSAVLLSVWSVRFEAVEIIQVFVVSKIVINKNKNTQKDAQESTYPLRVPNGGVAAQLLRKHIVFDVLVFAENWKKIKMHRKMRTSRFPPYGFEMAELRLNAFENI